MVPFDGGLFHTSRYIVFARKAHAQLRFNIRFGCSRARALKRLVLGDNKYVFIYWLYDIMRQMANHCFFNSEEQIIHSMEQIP
jgi:hypothetical protein